MAAPIIAAVAQGVGNTIGSGLAGYGQWKGAKAAQSQIKQGMTEQGQMADEQRLQQQQLQQPWISGGQQGFTDLQQFKMREATPYQASTFSGVNMSEDPGAQYRLDQSTKALDASASSRGSLFSGSQQKALQANAQNLASQEFANAYGRQYGQFKDTETAAREQYNTEADRTMNYDQYRMQQLQNIANMGQTATGQLGSAYGNIGSNEAQNMMTLRGAYADASAARSAAPWTTAGAMVSGGGNTAGNVASYYMKK